METDGKMHRYGDGDHDSGVIAYLFVKNGIILKFKSKEESYLYNYKKPGAEHLANMKKLAIDGSGLSTYVNQHVKENYFKKSKDLYSLVNSSKVSH